MKLKPGGKMLSVLTSVILAVGLVPVLPSVANAQKLPSGTTTNASGWYPQATWDTTAWGGVPRLAHPITVPANTGRG